MTQNIGFHCAGRERNGDAIDVLDRAPNAQTSSYAYQKHYRGFQGTAFILICCGVFPSTRGCEIVVDGRCCGGSCGMCRTIHATSRSSSSGSTTLVMSRQWSKRREYCRGRLVNSQGLRLEKVIYYFKCLESKERKSN